MSWICLTWRKSFQKLHLGKGTTLRMKVSVKTCQCGVCNQALCSAWRRAQKRGCLYLHLYDSCAVCFLGWSFDDPGKSQPWDFELLIGCEWLWLQQTHSYWHRYCRLHTESSGYDLQNIHVNFHGILHQNKRRLLQCFLQWVYHLCEPDHETDEAPLRSSIQLTVQI